MHDGDKSDNITRLTPAQLRMLEENFDPLKLMIKQYERLISEDDYQCVMRKNIGVDHFDSAGEVIRKVRYSSITHANILNSINTLGLALMKYMYCETPKPAVAEIEKIVEPVVINLTFDEPPSKIDIGDL